MINYFLRDIGALLSVILVVVVMSCIKKELANNGVSYELESLAFVCFNKYDTYKKLKNKILFYFVLFSEEGYFRIFKKIYRLLGLYCYVNLKSNGGKYNF